MLKNVQVTNYLGDKLVLELASPEKSGFAIFNITGIGPTKANISITDIVTADGGVVTNKRVTSRNITMSLRFYSYEFKPIEEIRHESYKYFPVKQSVHLRIETDNRIAEIEGEVESNEVVIFSKEAHTQISIICPYPYFYSDEKTITTFEGVVSKFEFPFSNESLTEDLIIMGTIWPDAARTIYYDGDAEVGVLINVFARDEVSNLTIFDNVTGRIMSINNNRLVQLTGSGIVRGDNVIISTVRGNKFIKLIREGVEYNILNALNRDAYWFQLRKGDNIFSYTAEFGLANIDFRIENRTVYEGV